MRQGFIYIQEDLFSHGIDQLEEFFINAGVKILFMKGMSSDSKGNMNWRSGNNGNWLDAVKRYNGGGDPNYMKKFNTTYDNIKPATPANY